MVPGVVQKNQESRGAEPRSRYGFSHVCVALKQTPSAGENVALITGGFKSVH